MSVNHLGETYLAITRFYLKHTPRTTRLGTFLIWPITSRIVGTHYDSPITLKNGIKMKTDMSDLLGRFILFYGPVTDYIWEPQTIRLMELLVKDAQSAVIAGAHLGYTALMARKTMSKSATLHTFEPIPYLYNLASQNAEMNRSSTGDLTVHPEALSDKEGTVNMVIDNIRSRIGAEQGDAKTNTPVRTVSIDQLIAEGIMTNPDFALFDVEGHELAVFAGMKKVFETKPPTNIIFEVSPQVAGGDVDIAPYIEALSPYQYTFYYIEDDYKCDLVGHTRPPIQLKPWSVNFKTDTRYYNVLATRLSQVELSKLDVQIV